MPSDNMKMLKRLFPELRKELRKGDCGKIGVLGGSAEYTGAPYFASITPMKIGADLSFVYAHPAAASVIKSYSPELIVYPETDFTSIKHSIEKLDALVFGPGLGRQKHTRDLLVDVVKFAKVSRKLCLVIDADGLFYIKENLDLFRIRTQNHSNIVITPNHREFARLYKHVFPDREAHMDDLEAQKRETEELARNLGVAVVRKGSADIIADGNDQTRVSDAETSARRCGGQGDILSGAIALFSFWAKRASHSENYTSEHLMEGAEAASSFLRMTSLETFKEIGRSMNAADIIAHIPKIVRRIDNHKL